MIQIKTDLHTHTQASGHAYSTIAENIANARSLGLEAVGIADHYSGMFYPSTDFGYYASFSNYKAIPENWDGVHFLKGAEADIVSLDGKLFGYDLTAPRFSSDMPPLTYEQLLLGRLDYVIASVHFSDFTKDASLAETTEMYCKALQHPKVLMIGHIGRAKVPFDIDEVLLTAKSLNKMIEINEASFGYPEDITGMCRRVAKRCAELGVKIAVNSDAHAAWYVGRYEKAPKMLEEIGFPEELIGNRDFETITRVLEEAGTRAARI